jgi:hypothetical protein
MVVRNKELKLRLIDPNVLEQDNQALRFLNAGLPVALILVFGLIKFYWRKKKYT